MQLEEIATISSGYLFRKRLQPKPGGKYRVVQMKDIDRFSRLDVSGLLAVDLDSVRQDYMLRQGDVLFRSRGHEHLATFVEKPLGKILAGSHFFILRVSRGDVLPEYLAWYLNQAPAQRQIAKAAAGTGTKHINIANLMQIEIKVPDLDSQKKVVELDRLSVKEQEILEALQQKKRLLQQTLLLKTINRNSGSSILE